ncbi:alpha-L-rhamnosidase [Rhizocola hellebori]|uniref:alpha-L-rhamnosidase n=1 Tax=Rhizocola hellebori TaxID=1392758 RepID=A0A8J3VCX2_9ACTN|nr:glycoside hydrolase family 78 protein [Rhizocola hellebori]GIH02994.1 alpha-L-rhamnosidase [Rhizocola hellebori]
MSGIDAPVKVVRLKAEHHREPLGIGQIRPRLSWQVETEHPDWTQTAYQIAVVSDDEPDRTVLSMQIPAQEQTLVPWPLPPLASRSRCAVKVRVWHEQSDDPSPWSPPLIIETGLVRPEDWTARMITPDLGQPADRDWPALLLRRAFTLPAAPVRARLYVAAQGVYEMELNGERVGDHVLAPGWTSYHHRLRYQTFDVTHLLRDGGNAIGGWLAEGWYRGRLGFLGGKRAIYGAHVGLFAQLEVVCADGSTVVVATDESWRAGASPIVATGLYDGEHYDARLERAGWSAPGFDDRDWAGVTAQPFDARLLVAPDGPPVRRTESIAPVAITTLPSGKTIVDFGQNLTGRVRIRVRGEAGRTIVIRHAEILQDSELCTAPLRHAAATDGYTLRGDAAIEEWEPRFTLHGFRYAEVVGWPGELHSDDIDAVICHTDMARTGWFACSDPLLERFHENVVWSMRGNFVDVPTDCPQRDERLGWTGDIAVFAPTASFLFDCAGMLTSWLADLAAEQGALGTVPAYVPWIDLVFPVAPTAVWGDAAVSVPTVLHERFADVGVLRQQYASMKAWVEQVAALAGDRRLWTSGFQFGDWLDPAAPPDKPAAARTDAYLVATAYHARSAAQLAAIAALLGEDEDHLRYTALAAEVADAFNNEFVTPNGRVVSDAQTAYAVALHANLLEKSEQRERAGRRLVELVEAGGHHVATGFVGTPLICDALTAVGADDTAGRLLMQRQCPSWLYPVTMGATTIWERWDSMLPDGTVNPGEMTSFNHYALGAVADWLHRRVAGLAPAAPGYRRVAVRPRPGGGLTHASAAYESPFGRIEVAWRRAEDRLHVDVTIPPGVTAFVELPDPSFSPVDIGSGRHTFTCAWPNPSDS